MTNQSRQSSKTLRAVSPHSLVAEKLAKLVEQAGSIENLSVEFLTLLRDAEQTASGLEPYLASCTTPESSDLARLVADTQGADWKQHFDDGETSLELEAEMVSGHVEGQFLKMLVGMLKATRVLEIGLFTGYSALAMAEALPEHGKLIACEVDAFAADFAQRQFDRSRHGYKIHVEVGEALPALHRLSETGQSFDLIFIDADKAGYSAYLDVILQGSLLAPNGVICVDNTLMQGLPYLPGPMAGNGLAIAEFNRKVAADSRVHQVVIALRDGLTLIRRIPT
jgi:caffeoyl-CoA O-methyltransferase